ncbi:MAG: DUF11 domain-containing protein [Parachlamydiaceae bacterium]|nr:DUF11 domain-containing protein [Parachlamydiaceae bacterium]
MKKQLGLMTSLVFLALSAFLWTGCADKCCDDNNNNQCVVQSATQSDSTDQSEPACPPECKPFTPPPCPPVCAPQCPPPRACPPPPPCPPPCPPPPAFKPMCAPPCPPPSRPVCAPPCPPPSRPMCAPPCPPPCREPLCKPQVRCKYPSSNELACRDGIIVTARNPQMCMLGDQYPIDFDVKACDDVCDVEVTARLPEGVTFVRSQPEARVEGRKLTWNIGHMSKGECRPAKVWVKCDCEGDLCACFCAKATPVRFCSLLCAHPILTCEMCGPDEVCPGDQVQITVSVTNRGSCAAEEVVLTNNVPDGFEHNSCLRSLTFKLGSIDPCQTKKVNLCFTAVKRGKICDTSVITACNADSTSCQCCVNVCKECIEICKVGPKEQMIGKNADYQITVVNPGDKPLTDVIVTDAAPSSTSIVSANGSTINGNQAVWRMREIKPGEKVTLPITLTTCTPGCFTNRVSVTNCQGCCANAEFTTRWKGRPALNVCICDLEDPICIGEPTSYCITVVNQGSESDNNVRVVVNFPREIVPVSATGDTPGQVSGQSVTYEPYNNLGPRQTLRYRVDARAKESGDARIKVEVTSDSIKTPIVQQESTIVN